MTEPLRIAVVGAGPMGRHHALAAKTLAPSARVVAIADQDAALAAALAAEVGDDVRPFSDATAMLHDARPDVVHIVTSPSSHTPLARIALEAGAHVYVEKPFTEYPDDARALFALAAARGLRVTAGHQLLYERPTLLAADWLPRIGRVEHVESYFAFRQTNRPGGRTPYTPIEQLLDILPHPAYLLFHFLGEAAVSEPLDVSGLRVDPRGTVHAIVDGGAATGMLVATLHGRPVDSFVRVVGTQGSLTLDYVRGVLVPSIGAGSTIEKVLDPYGRGLRGIGGTTASLARRFLKRQRSYPGLAEAFAAFYRHVRGGPAPYPAEAILRTVELCAMARERLEAAERDAGIAAAPAATPPTVAVTGGTGLLGRRVVRRLREEGVSPLAIARRTPTAAQREPGVHYVAADLGTPGGLVLPDTITTVIHCAAETAGSWDAHQRNTIDATRHVLDAMHAAGATQLLNVSSLAVLDADAQQPLSESSPVERAPRRRGAYVWGKLTAEQLAEREGPGLGIAVKTVRPGALVDAGSYTPPGKLGRQIGRWFVAFDSPRATIPVSDLDRVADILTWTALHFEEAEGMLHAIEPEPVTRRALVDRVRSSRPGTRVVWIYRPMLRVSSWILVALQKVLRRTATPVNLWTVFQAPRCDTTMVQRVIGAMTPPASRIGAGRD